VKKTRIEDLRTHPEPYVTVSQLAHYWGISRKQVLRKIDAGTLQAIQLGSRLLHLSTADAIHFEQMAKTADVEE
jgi:excisionase family DNA binding protein